jgi:chorismate-pyruvate lyase
MSLTTRKLYDFPGAEAALRDLTRPFCASGGASLSAECELVDPDRIPFPEDQLLVHHDHMTEVLEKHFGAPVDVQVLAEQLDGDIYTRQIALHPKNQPDKVVEWGFASLDLRFLSQPVKDEILAKKIPLGAVLMKHNVLRRVKPRWFLKLPDNAPTLRLFGPLPHPGPVYGRIGTIYCDGEPAIQVLEIVLNTRNA